MTWTSNQPLVPLSVSYLSLVRVAHTSNKLKGCAEVEALGVTDVVCLLWQNSKESDHLWCGSTDSGACPSP